jgi:hypothetical protein
MAELCQPFSLLNPRSRLMTAMVKRRPHRGANDSAAYGR